MFFIQCCHFENVSGSTGIYKIGVILIERERPAQVLNYTTLILFETKNIKIWKYK